MNYQNGKIYRIDCLTTGEVYIGSTTQPTVAKRLAHHVSSFKRWKKTGKGFVSSYPVIERDNYQITMIEAYPCNSKDELHSREGYFIRTIDCVNKRIAGRTKQEYCESNREQISEQRKEYRETNKKQIAEQGKIYYETNKKTILEKKKDNYEVYKEQILKQRKDYYESNKEQINAKRRKNK